jgi:hypothetical protein
MPTVAGLDGGEELPAVAQRRQPTRAERARLHLVPSLGDTRVWPGWQPIAGGIGAALTDEVADARQPARLIEGRRVRRRPALWEFARPEKRVADEYMAAPRRGAAGEWHPELPPAA